MHQRTLQWYADEFVLFFLGTLMPLFETLGFNKNLVVNEKPREGMGPELVSGLDTEIQNRYKTLFLLLFPDTEFIGEESAHEWPPRSRSAWIVDPMDGTHNALSGIPSYGSMCALVEDGVVAVSAILLPAHQQMGSAGIYIAKRNEGAWQISAKKYQDGFDFEKQAKRIRVTDVADLAKALVLFEGPTKRVLASRVVEKTKVASMRHRDNIASCFSGVLVASGGLYPSGFDAIVSCDLKPWDCLPIALLIEEAGGTVTDHNGNPYSLTNCSSLIFSNGKVHDQILALGKET